MTRLASCTPKDVCRALERAGFVFTRQRGSHRIYRKDARSVTIPYHSKDLKRGTLNAIVKAAGLTPEEFVRFL